LVCGSNRWVQLFPPVLVSHPNTSAQDIRLSSPLHQLVPNTKILILGAHHIPGRVGCGTNLYAEGGFVPLGRGAALHGYTFHACYLCRQTRGRVPVGQESASGDRKAHTDVAGQVRLIPVSLLRCQVDFACHRSFPLP